MLKNTLENKLLKIRKAVENFEKNTFIPRHLSKARKGLACLTGEECGSCCTLSLMEIFHLRIDDNGNSSDSGWVPWYYRNTEK